MLTSVPSSCDARVTRLRLRLSTRQSDDESQCPIRRVPNDERYVSCAADTGTGGQRSLIHGVYYNLDSVMDG
jgi:hypothetical protein